MKKWFTLGVIFLASYLVFIVATLPLALVINNSKLPKNISIQAISGTVWQGEIGQVTVDKNIIKQVTTKLSFWSLFTLMPKVDISFGSDILAGPQGQLTLAISQSKLNLSDVNIFLSANEIAQQARLPLPITAKGEVELNFSDISIALDTRKCSEAKGKVDWSRAGVIAMEQNIKLGKFSSNITCEKGELVAKIAPKNDIGLSFTAYVSSTGNSVRVSGNGYIKPGVKFPAKLKSALSFLGNPDAQGRYRLNF